MPRRNDIDGIDTARIILAAALLGVLLIITTLA